MSTKRDFTSTSEERRTSWLVWRPSAVEAKAVPAFTLLMSVLVASIVLALGYEIYNIATKEVTLSSAGRESQFAFFAADTGIECALYWDSKFDAFALDSELGEISCGEGVTTLTRDDSIENMRITSFNFNLTPSPSGQCVNVVVTRESPPKTKIESFGYNTCNLGANTRIERAIRVTY